LSYERLQVASFKVEREVLAELDELARRMDTSRSEVIRRAIMWYIKAYARPSVTPRMKIYTVPLSKDSG
jgi:metal-responsive CopG/Arc/MetJ family transcriptional regulator